MKFNLKKFQEDRTKSLNRSKKGELDLIGPRILPTHEEIKQKFKIYDSPLLEDIYKCNNRTVDIFETSICKLPFSKRDKKNMCDDCDLKLS